MRTLEELDQAVDELQQGQVDQLQPGVFSINAAGELEEILSGKLEAKGIIFNIELAGEARSIVWKSALTPTALGELTMELTYHGVKKTPPISLTFELFSSLGGERFVALQGEVNDTIGASITARAVAQSVLLINESGESTFARLTALLAALEKIAKIEEPPRFEVSTLKIVWPKLAAGTVEKLPLTGPVYDTAGYWDAVNKRYTPLKAGVYLFTAFAFDVVNPLAANKFWSLRISKNKLPVGVSSDYRQQQIGVVEAGLQGGYSVQAVMNGTTDFIEVWGNTTDPKAGQEATVILTGVYLGK